MNAPVGDRKSDPEMRPPADPTRFAFSTEEYPRILNVGTDSHIYREPSLNMGP